tara:strand:+ start:3866 stop:6424 length:2559 start_codon:yes stop_codon:yes gene_type:complete
MATERNPYDKIPSAEVIQIPDQGANIEIGETVSFDIEEDGGVVVSFENEFEYEEKTDIKEWFENLAEDMEDFDLVRIAEGVYDRYDADLNSRSEWESMFERGFDLLGLKLEDTSEPFEGACTAVHPLLVESAVKFQSKAISELFPPAGPVKSQVLGTSNFQKDQQAQRVQEFMNYQLTEQMPEYFDEFERMLFHLPLIGSAFKKVYYDASLERPVAEFVPIDQFYVSYYASDLRKADRYTHIIYRSPHDLMREIRSGMYLDIELPDAYVPSPTPISSKIDTVMGMSQTGEDDPQYVLLEQHCYLELESDPEYSEGVALPYIVTVEEQSRQILSIRRNYRPDDPTREKIMHFVHYRFVPGFGFYGLGLIHFLGNLTLTATAAMRALVDAGQFSNLPGGFKAKGVRIVGDNDPIAPGEFKEVEATGMDLSKSIVPLPYKEPSSTLFQMLNFVTATGQKFADSTEQVVSDASSYGPVGTTMALLEASSKFFSAIHKRLHKSQKDEFKILAKINYDYLPNEYPFDVPGMSQKILKRDFDGRIDVIPVSDPNIPSNAHRMMLAQMALQLAQQSPPGMFNLEALNRTILDAANMPNLDEILPPKKEPRPLDPLSDIAAATRGLPIAAFPGQNHDAHVQVKMAFLQDPMNGKNPAMQRVVPVLQSNIQEHIIMKYQEQVTGVAQNIVGNLPPEQQQMPNVMEVAMAQAASQVQNANQAMGQQQSPEAQMVDLEKARLQIEQQKLQLDTMKNASEASLKNRELDIEETEVALKAIQDGQQQLIKSEEKEKDRINKQTIKAVDTLVNAATEDARLQNAQQLKAMDLLGKLTQISEGRESTENIEGLRALMKVIETAISKGE